MEKQIIELIKLKSIFGVTKNSKITEYEFLKDSLLNLSKTTQTAYYENFEFLAYKYIIQSIVLNIQNINFKYKKLNSFIAFCNDNNIEIETNKKYSDEDQICLSCNKDTLAFFDKEKGLLEKLVQ